MREEGRKEVDEVNPLTVNPVEGEKWSNAKAVGSGWGIG